LSGAVLDNVHPCNIQPAKDASVSGFDLEFWGKSSALELELVLEKRVAQGSWLTLWLTSRRALTLSKSWGHQTHKRRDRWRRAIENRKL